MKNKIFEALALLAEWQALEKKLKANKISTKQIKTIKRIYLGVS